MQHTFNNFLITESLSILGVQPIEVIARERSVTSCSPEWVMANATPIIKDTTEEILSLMDSNGEELPSGYHYVVDARVQRLMPGMFPSIPGWHCDGVPRSSYTSQPDLTKVEPNARHAVVLFATGNNVSNTEFINNTPVTVDISDDPIPVWRQVHRAVENQRMGRNEIYTTTVTPGDIAIFDQCSIHRATPTQVRGWRIFYRLSMMPTPPMELGFTNQEQVYLLSEENGW